MRTINDHLSKSLRELGYALDILNDELHKSKDLKKKVRLKGIIKSLSQILGSIKLINRDIVSLDKEREVL